MPAHSVGDEVMLDIRKNGEPKAFQIIDVYIDKKAGRVTYLLQPMDGAQEEVEMSEEDIRAYEARSD